MAKTIFEEMGGAYHRESDYSIPNLTLSAEEVKPIGVWGQRHRGYLNTESSGSIYEFTDFRRTEQLSRRHRRAGRRYVFSDGAADGRKARCHRKTKG